MSSCGDSSPTLSPRDPFRARSETPDIVEPPEFTSISSAGPFNLADELAMAEDSEHEGDSARLLAPSWNRSSLVLSDYEGSEYGDVDDDSDGYLTGHINADERQLDDLAADVALKESKNGIITQFVEHLRCMRGQTDVENNAKRYFRGNFFSGT
jgi:hypothetical protein